MREPDASDVEIVKKLLATRWDAGSAGLSAEQTDAVSRLVDRVEYLSAGLDAVGRAGRTSGSCLPKCSAWKEDYQVNDCDCGYVEAADNSADFAEAVLSGDVTLDAAWRE